MKKLLGIVLFCFVTCQFLYAQENNSSLKGNLRLNITEEVENTILQKEIKEEINSEKIPNEPNNLIQDETEKQTTIKKPEIIPIKTSLKDGKTTVQIN